jgi:hypothetical protein
MTTECNNCNKCFPPEKIFECDICNREDDSESEDALEKDISKKPTMCCKRCSDKCFGCELRGCTDCVDVVCCDCSVSMCVECRNGDILCGCYGKCYFCNRDVDRGTDGWPCGECNRWGCYDCRVGDNGCKECNPNYEEDESEDKKEDIKTEKDALFDKSLSF